MAVAELFSRIRRKKVEAEISSFGHYRSLLIALANGSELDSDEAEIVLQDLGKSESDVEQDVETMRKRLANAEKLSKKQNSAKVIESCQAEMAKANAEFQAVQEKHNARVAEISQKRKAAEATVIAADQARAMLLKTCINPEIKDRESELLAQRSSLAPRRKTLTDELNVFNAGSLENNLSIAKQDLADFKEKLAGEFSEERKGACAIQIKRLSNVVATLEERRTRFNGELEELNQQASEINNELEELKQKKLTP